MHTSAMAGSSNINTQAGLLTNAKVCLSPNHDDRPDQSDISLIVIHNISLPPNEFGGRGIEQLFLNQLDKNEHPFYADIYHLRVSSHLLIRRDGEVVQFVPFHKRAWHAGESVFLGRDVCNDFSIGIELEGSDFEAFTQEQYVALEVVLNDLLEAYPSLSAELITGHEHIAPGRKTDPGPYFEWNRLAKSMKVTLPARCHKSNEK